MHRRLSIALAVLTLIAFTSIFLQIGNNDYSRWTQSAVKISERNPVEEIENHPAYEPHYRIAIYGDEDFVDQGWPGTGSQEDPFLIEGLEIVDDNDCITIYSTDAYFVIRDCLVRSLAPTSYRDGIRVGRATHGIIENCVVDMKGYGITVYRSSNIAIRNNTVRNSPNYGIHLQDSSSCNVSENNVSEIPSTGILSLTNTACQFANNTVWACDAVGLRLSSSDGCTVLNNTIHDCGASGISLDSSPMTMVKDNVVHSNVGSGIYNSDSNQCEYINNEIYENEVGGASIHRADNCSLEGNQIHDNIQNGVYLDGLSCNLTNNIFLNDGLSLMGINASDWSHNIEGNTVNGKSLGYFFNQSDFIVDGNNYGQIIIAYSLRLTVQGGIIGNSDIGIASYVSTSIDINSVTIEDETHGIYLYSSMNCNVTDSTLTGCGVSVVGSLPEYWTHNFTGTTVNGLPIAHCYNETDLIINGIFYGQAIIVNSTRIHLMDGNFVNASQGIAIAFSKDCTISRNVIENGYNGMRIRECKDSHFENNSIENTFERGVLVYYSQGCTFTNNTIANCEIGIYLYYSENCGFNESTLLKNGYGIYSSHSSYLNFSENLVEDNYWGYRFSYTNHSNIGYETIRTSDADGMYLYYSHYVVVEDCVIENNGNNGIYFTSSFNGSIIHNEVNLNGYDGISIWTSDGFTVINNTASENNHYGILLHHFCENNTIYGNTISDNIVGNGYDYESENSWDDGNSTGNFWSDYIGPGPYFLDGPGNNVDNYPRGPAVVLFIHADASYHLGTNPSLTWDAFSTESDYFIVFRDGEIQDSGIWNGLDVTTSVVADTLGVFNYTLFVNGTSGEYKTNTVMVTIYDTTPTINSPYDTAYNYDTTDHSITWQASDFYNPYGYYVYQNDSLWISGVWDGSSIEISIDGLPIGFYNIMIIVNDTSGNSISDLVRVTVWDNEPWLDSPYGDITYTEGASNQVIYWNASDFNPANYTVYRNSALLSFSWWNGESISYQVHGLAVGVYNYTLMVCDTSGQTAYDTVFVTVLPGSIVTTTTTTTTDNSLIQLIPLAVSIVSIAVIALVAILIIQKRR